VNFDWNTTQFSPPLRLAAASLLAGQQLFSGFSASGAFLERRRQSVLKRQLREAERSGEQEVRSVERRSDLGLEEFRARYQEPGIPVVFSQKARDWNCSKIWSLDYLTQQFGKDLLPIDHSFSYLKEVLTALKRGESKVLRFYSLIQRHPELMADLDMNFLLQHRNPGAIFDQGFQAFINNENSEPTALHHANDANLFIQVQGKKRWVLYPSHLTSALQPAPLKSEYRVQRPDSAFDPFAPDYDAHPVYRYLPRYEVTLEPGDVLWNPPYVWHAVKTLTPETISLGFRWMSPSHCIRLSPLLSALDCCATSPPIWKSIRLADRDFSLVFVEQFPELKEHPRYPRYLAQIEEGYARYQSERPRWAKLSGARLSTAVPL
jgi:hypothetical protein